MSAALVPRLRNLLADRRAGDLLDADLLRIFIEKRDENAFAALVRRHGPLVLATARRVVGNADDADDVFQATFLLLARQAGAIRNPAALAGWLHGVASRMARTARRSAARRRNHEARVVDTPRASGCDLSWREVQTLFEEELARLPDRWRVPFVLCTLNGEPRVDVARRLGIKEGTISSRLAEAKRRLQQRLSARGVSLAVVLGALSLPAAAVSNDLVARTIQSTAGPVSASVSNLIRGGVMTSKKMLFAVAIALSTAILALGPGQFGDAAKGGQQPHATGKSPPNKPVAKTAATIPLVVRGKLLDVDGKPLADVPVQLWSFRTGDKAPEPVTKTAADGSFQFETDPQAAVEDARVVLTPNGKPAVWRLLSGLTTEQTLKVPADDVPITGRILTLENQPLKDVTVEIVRVGIVGQGELSTWLDKNVAMRKEHYWLNEIGLLTVPGSFVLNQPKVITDRDGRFKLSGLGRDRVVTVRVHGKNVETKFFWVVTRSGAPAKGYIHTPDFNHGLYAPNVTVMLAPSRPLVGTVTDAKTGKPVAGAKVSEVNSHIAWATTDKDGKYRLEGVPKKSNYALTVAGQKGLPVFDYTSAMG